MNRYTPITNYQRHEAYLCAFDSSINIEKYFKVLKKFIMDENMSPHDENDLQLLKDLLFETKFGKNHIYFYHLIYFSMRKSNNNFKILNKYTDFLGAMSDCFLDDMFNFVIKTKNKHFIRKYFVKLSSNNKVKFLRILKNYPNIIEHFPKLKAYALFY